MAKRKIKTTYHNGFSGVKDLTWNPEQPLTGSAIVIAIEHGYQRARKYGATTLIYLTNTYVYTTGPKNTAHGGIHIATISPC